MTRAVVILGMHRSGTSCLTGSLEQAGLFLGDVITSAAHNAKGNRENRRIMDFHEALLKANGGSWDDPPEIVLWSEDDRRQRDGILAAYGDVSRFGFKDPRTLFTLGGWLEVLTDVRYVGTFRHPLAVANSLMRRNGGTVERWVNLWVRYNQRLLAIQSKTPFPLVSFDDPDEVYRKRLLRVIGELAIVPEVDLAFFEGDLRHHRPTSGEVPEPARALYAELRAIAERTRSP